jgi:hypothetical protein
MTTLYYTPLDLPKIQPKNWDQWWEVWNTYSAVISKNEKNHNDTYGLWKGLDLYRDPSMVLKLRAAGLTGVHNPVYNAPYHYQSPVVIDLVHQVISRFPMHVICIRVIENLDEVPPHSDESSPAPNVRSILWSDYTEPIWRFDLDEKSLKMVLPDDTNSFYYLDYPLKHSAIYRPGNTKGVLVVYGVPMKDKFKEMTSRSYLKYIDYTWLEE